MPENCAVVLCSKARSDGVSLHAIPSLDQDVADKWREFIHNVNKDYAWKEGKNVLLCSDHFKSECFVGPIIWKRRLIHGSIPSLIDGKDASILNESTKIQPLTFFNKVELPHTSTTPSQSEALYPCQINLVYQDDHLKCKEELARKDEIIQKLQKQLKECKNELFNLSRRFNRCEEAKRKLKENASAPPSKIQRKEDPANSLSEEQESLRKLLSQILERLSCSPNVPYSEAIREFAFSVYYYSPRAYMSLRAAFQSTLPHPRSFNRWTAHIDASPGFLRVSLEYIAHKVKSSPTKLLYCLSFDEIHIRRQIIFKEGRFLGFVDYGGLLNEPDTDREASAALFIMATELNGSFKIPIGYILTKGLPTILMSKVISASLMKMNEVGATVFSITFDGLKSNFGAVESLGAKLNPFRSNFSSHIQHPVTQEKVHIFVDPSHMFKLFRNVLKTKQLTDYQNRTIDWVYIKRLHELQLKNGLRAGNKLTSRHVDFEAQKMKTRLCTQVISNSVAVSLRFCRKIGLKEFEGSEATEECLTILDRLFDGMNSKNHGKGYKSPLSLSNKDEWNYCFEDTKKYLLELKTVEDGKLKRLIHTRKGTAVKGLVVSIASLQSIIEDLIEESDLKFIPTYRMGQDMLETFFSLIRSRFGFNNNPNVLQLSALRGILCSRLGSINTGNCIEQEEICSKISCFNSLSALMNRQEELQECTEQSEESIPELPRFVKCVVTYIGGYISRNLLNKLKCADCMMKLYLNEENELEDFELINEKDNGGLVKPSQAVVRICNVVEQKIRQVESNGLKTLTSSFIVDAALMECTSLGLLEILCCDSVTHLPDKYYLSKLIVEEFLRVRLYHIAKESTLKLNPTTNRSVCTKVVHFNGL